MDKVRCPYPHGGEMKLIAEYRETYTKYNYACSCGARSPSCTTPDAAYAAAMQRWVEPLKPLELHEVTGSEEPCVFLEINNMEPIWACDCVISSDLKGVHISFIGDRGCTLVAMFDYCKTWRCWARRPTDEERAGAGWVDEAGE